MKILLTGGAGFIGSHLVRYFVKKYSNYEIYNLDCLSYAGNLLNLVDTENEHNYNFIKGDIRDREFINFIFKKYKFDNVINLAAESHVDRSIKSPEEFVETNVLGTFNLLNSFKNTWFKNFENKLFYQVSTDEVYGSIENQDFSNEETRYDPRSPYSASKASSDHFVKAFGNTYKMPYIISYSSNNYGEYQFPEKIIPLTINNILNNKEIPIYGDGTQVRDWLYVLDHVQAIDSIFHSSKKNNVYNIGGMNQISNVDLVSKICGIIDTRLNKKEGSSLSLIRFVEDRPGHDKRYALDISKINNQLGWKPKFSLDEGLRITIDWYLSNNDWLEKIKSGDYMNYYNKNYTK